MAPAVRVALVGYGLGGSVFHAPLIQSTPGLELSAIVTSDPRRRAAASSRYPGAVLLTGMDELLRHPGYGLVVVTTPNASHFAVARAVLDAGIPAVVDKPVTPSAAEAVGLAEAADRRGVAVIPFHNRRWDGDYMTVRDLIATGNLGDVWRYESRFERWKPKADPPRSWKQDGDQPGGGILYDLGSHLIDQALHLFGRPSAVYAEQARHVSRLDDDAFIALTYDRGPAVHLWVSSSAARLGPRFRVLGARAGYVKFGMDPQEEALKGGAVPGGADWGQEPADAWGILGTVDHAAPIRTRPGAYQDFYLGVADHLLRGAVPPVDIGDAVAGLQVIEAAMRSAESRSVVAL